MYVYVLFDKTNSQFYTYNRRWSKYLNKSKIYINLNDARKRRGSFAKPLVVEIQQYKLEYDKSI